MRIALLADTHITAGGRRRLPASVYHQLERADVIIHAGDIVVGEVLDDLARFAPVHAVLGNNDRGLRLPPTVSLDLPGGRVGVIHDSGPRTGRERRLHRLFPEADVVVFGHSHIPIVSLGVDRQMLVNPGSPTDKRRQPDHTMAVLHLSEGRRPRARLIRLPD